MYFGYTMCIMKYHSNPSTRVTSGYGIITFLDFLWYFWYASDQCSISQFQFSSLLTTLVTWIRPPGDCSLERRLAKWEDWKDTGSYSSGTQQPSSWSGSPTHLLHVRQLGNLRILSYSVILTAKIWSHGFLGSDVIAVKKTITYKKSYSTSEFWSQHEKVPFHFSKCCKTVATKMCHKRAVMEIVHLGGDSHFKACRLLLLLLFLFTKKKLSILKQQIVIADFTLFLFHSKFSVQLELFFCLKSQIILFLLQTFE